MLRRELRAGISIHPTPSVVLRCILPRMESASSDPELQGRLRWLGIGTGQHASVCSHGRQGRLRRLPGYDLLRPVLLELKRQYPQCGSEPNEPVRWLPALAQFYSEASGCRSANL